MKIFICTDAEGVSCLDKKDLIDQSTMQMRTRLMADVNAAVRGDFAACAEAREFFGPIRTACVKYGIDHENAACLPAQEAELLIYQAAKEAVGIASTIRPYRVSLPAEVVVEFNRTDHCTAVLKARPELEQLDGRTLRKVSAAIKAYTDVLL